MIEASGFLSPSPPLSLLRSRLGVFLHCHNQVRVSVAAQSLPDHGGERRSLYLSSASRPVRRLWPSNDELGQNEEEEIVVPPPVEEVRRRRKGNWVMKILRIRAIWEREKEKSGGGGEEDVNRMLEMGDRCVGCCDGEEGCDVGGEYEKEVEIDRDSFSRLLRRASLAEAKLYAKLSYLGSLAYSIPKIKTGNLLKYHGLRFVTSSLEKKSIASNVGAEQPLVQNQSSLKKKSKASNVAGEQPVENELKDSIVMSEQPILQNRQTESREEAKIQTKNPISVSGTHQIVASAASYLHSQTKSILPFGHTKTDVGTDSPEEDRVGDKTRDGDITNSRKASFVVTTDSVTAVVAGKEEMKEAFSKELKHSSPCEWFICDDESSGTRFFVIQGSESLASWQTNLLFEPVQFEGIDVLVHRGIYEAAKGIYEQMLPEVQSHLQSRGETATLRFTGHSLGGSLSLLVNLMLLIRGEAPASSLLPVITYGAPSIMCGGNHLLQKLGLPPSHVQAITMHRDIVPRAFSCVYPDRVREILKAVNGNFRAHPCLKHQNSLYSPMGEILILQPDEKFSPNHHLLPSGSGLYFLSQPSDSTDSRRLLRSALSAFLNSPHPLEILSDRSAYGPEGVVNRDHDMNSYLRSVQRVITHERKRIRKAKRERRRKLWWPLVANEDSDAGGSARRRPKSKNVKPPQNNFHGLFPGGRASLNRIARIVTSRQTHVIVVLFLPARRLFFEVLTVSL